MSLGTININGSNKRFFGSLNAVKNYNQSVINSSTTKFITINSVTNNQSGDQIGTYETTDGITYNVYVLKTTGITYTINYTVNNSSSLYVLAVGGGGGGGCNGGGGGGAGGVIMTTVPLTTGNTGNINISVGAGGLTPVTSIGIAGGNTTVNFSTAHLYSITAGGGAGGGVYAYPSVNNNINSSGGGGGLASNPSNANTNYLVYANNGGIGDSNSIDGGGGGAGTPGSNGNSQSIPNGGNGIKCALPVIKDFLDPGGVAYGSYYWGGGGGGSSAGSINAGNGGLGGGGGGVQYNNNYAAGTGGGSAINSGGNGQNNNGVPGNGGANTGGGGGGSYNNGASTSKGGSGIVIIAIPFSVKGTVNVIPINTGSVLTNSSLSNLAYSNIKAVYGCILLNYNYTGPIMCLRYGGDTAGSNTQNFYSDISGNLYTGPNSSGITITSWLSSNNAPTTFAYLTKWYDQGMDLSFNNAYQFTAASQPIYDVIYKVINFGYTGAGGGIPAPQAGYLKLPLNAFPILDTSFTVVTKYLNWGNNNSDTQQDLIDIFANSQTGAIKFNSNGIPAMWLPNASTSGTALATNNGIITYKYTSFSTGGSLSNNYVIYQNSVQRGIAQRTNAVTTSPQINPSIGNSPNSYYANSGTVSGSTTNYYLQAQLHYLYIFGSALTDADRAIIETTPVPTISVTTPIPDLIWLKFDTTTYTGGQTLTNAGTLGTITCNFWSANGTITNVTKGSTTIALISNTTGSTSNGYWNVTSSTITIPTGSYGMGYTFCYWIYVPSNGLPLSNGATGMLASFGGTPNSATQGWINTYFAGNYFSGSGTGITNMVNWYYPSSAYNDTTFTSTTTYSKWYHIAIVQFCTNSNTSNVYIYKNGASVNTTTTTYPTSSQSINLGIATAQTSAYYSDVRVYGRPLLSSEITSVYNYGISAGISSVVILPKIVLYFPFSKDLLNYATGTGVEFWRTFDGTNAVGGSYGTGTVSIDTTNKWNSSINGTLKKTAGTSCLYGPSGYTLPANSNGYTISFWYYTPSNTGYGNNIFNFFNSLSSPAPTSNGTTNGLMTSWNYNAYTGQNNAGIIYFFGNGYNIGGFSSGPPTSAWVHIVISLTPTGAWSFYLVPLTTTTFPTSPGPNCFGTGSTYTSATSINDLRIFGTGVSGAVQSPYATTTFTTPKQTDPVTYYISDFYLFDGVLNTAQMQYLHSTQQYS
uniref:Glycine-rich domain-containing protein n=1 Tax=viral metagenome TaxID=1070528 RepID=A0A6C0HTG9_9ZZZZ